MLLGGLDHKNRSSQACSGIMIRTDGTADKWTDLAKGDVRTSQRAMWTSGRYTKSLMEIPGAREGES